LGAAGVAAISHATSGCGTTAGSKPIDPTDKSSTTNAAASSSIVWYITGASRARVGTNVAAINEQVPEAGVGASSTGSKGKAIKQRRVTYYMVLLLPGQVTFRWKTRRLIFLELVQWR
jgi:hypothetical protein